MTDGFDIRLVDAWPADQIVELYRAGGWWLDTYSSEGLDALICGSFAFAVAIDSSTGRAVGMGRAISDGVSDAWLQDIVVLNEFRGRDLGRAIIETLLEHCKSRGLVWVGLVAEPGTRKFYEPMGFEALPGEPMVFRSD
ncbi:MAG: GNAT family N-acetyltransferase [Candidatus Thermoplasmatota archaeon]|nr:GNAT family N-acetyltransferase [Euryarchaeota archaeon]MBU4033055.1 GNAT family N-acetyltransferase [Candidatus Thermoplasmatota archaeon]MBU4072107.1 GNAT family N-acetyltransferase [Candidatus Thermoplasmatota archaeon]MBU4143690.1 GNAT family N-acetyltransferase [Candidatus Thermoplasmatota archaeon]MBU4591796.1 GNAT family N-acetyltransferase [Candidatus Thermoplasmatota archaeon]